MSDHRHAADEHFVRQAVVAGLDEVRASLVLNGDRLRQSQRGPSGRAFEVLATLFQVKNVVLKVVELRWEVWSARRVHKCECELHS